MPVADISSIILARGRPGLNRLIEWLEENVGREYRISSQHPVQKVGDGWEIRVINFDLPEGLATGWELDITDEKKFMLYALRWA